MTLVKAEKYQSHSIFTKQLTKDLLSWKLGVRNMGGIIGIHASCIIHCKGSGREYVNYF